MKIVVAGVGKIGSAVAESLSREGHEIVVIDSEPEAVERVTSLCDVMGVSSGTTDYRTLCDVGMKDTELFIATAGSDEENAIACFMAKKLGARHTAARIRDMDPGGGTDFIRSQLEIDMVINPELLTAQTIFNSLKYPAAVRTETFTRRSFEMAELVIKPDTAFDGAVLSELRTRFKQSFLVCAVFRDRKAIIPTGSFRLEAGDKIGIIAKPVDLQKLVGELGAQSRRSRSIMLVGAGRISLYLTELLSKGGSSVKLIEKNEAVCERISGLLPHSAELICGDATKKELLCEEGLRHMDAFVSLTGIDEQNLLTSFLAQDEGVPNVITKLSRCGYDGMGEKLGLGLIVLPKSIVSDSIICYARALESSRGSQIETLYSLFDGEVEALEFEVTESFLSCGRRLADMQLKPNVLIAGILRNGKCMIPGGSDVFLPRDRVIVIAAGHRLRCLEEILR